MHDDSKKLLKQLKETLTQIETLKDNHEITTIIERLLIDLTHSEVATLLLFAPQEMKLYTYKELEDMTIVGSSGLLGIALLKQKSEIYNHLTSEKHYNPTIDNPYDMKLKAQIIHPLIQKGEIFGVVRLSRSIRSHRNYIKSDLDLLFSIDEFLIQVIEILRKNELHGESQVQDEVSQKITEVEKKHQKVEKKLQSDNDELNSNMLFLSNTVHDIRTPANSLYGFLDLIEERTKDERTLEFIANAKESAQFIHTLTDSILARIKHEKESLDSKLIVINTVKFFSGIANTFSANMSKKGIDYLIYIDPLIPKEIEVEELKLKRVLLNLIGNAYKFTPQGKSITLSIEYDSIEKTLSFSVKDTGIGIAKANQVAIFEAFKQAQEDTELHFGGTGLGLSISAKYVKELGGELKLESELEQGSDFYFTLPIKAVDATPAHLAFQDREKFISILTNDPETSHAYNIKRYLEALTMPSENILIANKISSSTTHLFCFEEMLDEELVEVCQNHKIKLIVVESEILSLSEKPQFKDLKVITQNTYYGNIIHAMVSSQRRPRILIADDNKINVMLIKTILESEYCEIHFTLDGQEALDILSDALESSNPFSLIFADKHMPNLSGNEVIQHYRQIEAKYKLPHPLVTVSITGDPNMSQAEKTLYDAIIHKPFNKNEIRNVFHQAIGEQ